MNKNYELPSAELLGDVRIPPIPWGMIESEEWRKTKADIPVFLGEATASTAWNVKIADLATAPHMLVAGAIGSGKSVFLNNLITSLLYRFSPDELKLILIDPMCVEFDAWRPLPHLITPVVNDPTKVPDVLRWAWNELEYRYQVMARVHAKNLQTFNSRPQDSEPIMDEEGNPIPQKMPRLIIIVSELSDMMRSKMRKDVETLLCRIAQKGRAAGIHMVIATQVPSKDVITDIIKANMPTRVAFHVSQESHSRLILDDSGAEKLAWMSTEIEMLFKSPGEESQRIQVPMMADTDIRNVVNFVSSQAEQHFDPAVISGNQEKEDDGTDEQDDFLDETTDQIKGLIEAMRENADDENFEQILEETLKQQLQQLAVHVVEKEMIRKYLQPGDDEVMRKALEVILREGKATTSYLQRRLEISYNKASEIMDKLEQRGIVSAPLPGGQKRNILILDEINPKCE